MTDARRPDGVTNPAALDELRRLDVARRYGVRVTVGPPTSRMSACASARLRRTAAPTPASVLSRPRARRRSPSPTTASSRCATASRVRLPHDGRVQTLRTFTPIDGQFDERCVTGALGRAHRPARRRPQLAGRRDDAAGRPPPRPSACAAPVVGLVVVARRPRADRVDLADGPPSGTVFGAAGDVVIAAARRSAPARRSASCCWLAADGCDRRAVVARLGGHEPDSRA